MWYGLQLDSSENTKNYVEKFTLEGPRTQRYQARKNMKNRIGKEVTQIQECLQKGREKQRQLHHKTIMMPEHRVQCTMQVRTACSDATQYLYHITIKLSKD